ncbi:MAG: hypothetical protein RL081_1612 [Pseudomonadota bacterium]
MRWSGRLAPLLRHMNTPTLIELIGATLFGVAVLHTFSTKFFERLAHTHPRHAGMWHLRLPLNFGALSLGCHAAFLR